MDWKYLFTSREGRISRKPFWLASLALFAGMLIVSFVFGPFLGVLSLLLFIPLVIAGFMVTLKRAHDRDRPEWYVIAYYALAILLTAVSSFMLIDPTGSVFFILNLVLGIWGLVMLIDLGFLRGTQGANRYGSDPLSA
jgi:uncharacterized membrane protein YhaH (DUF805 family)